MRYIHIVAIICIAFGCAPTHFVKPLEKKQQALNLSLGGPLIDYSKLIIPMPFITATYGYGFTSSLTGFASLNITSALYGNAQVELGLTKKLVDQHHLFPGISINPVANFIYRNKDAVKLYPQVDVNAWWDYHNGKNFFYVGLNNWFELSGKRAFNEKQEHHWLISPMVGHTFVRTKWNYTIEAKVIAPHISGASVVDYKTPFDNHGAFGLYFGLTRKF